MKTAFIGEKKFSPGNLVKTFDEVLSHAKRGGWFFDGKRVVHGSWIANMGVAVVARRLNTSLRFAHRNPNAPFVFEVAVAGEHTPKLLASCSEAKLLNVEASDLFDLVNNCQRAIRVSLGLDWALSNNCDPTIEIRIRA
jgi:hypothetical protein